MNHRKFLLALFVASLAGCNHDHNAQSPQSPASIPTTRAANDITDQFDVPEGLEVTVWADTPQLFNPTNIDIDARGRVWVTEGVNYRETWKKQNALKHPEGDRVMILQDTDGNGACDSSKVFAQDEDLLVPLGIGVLGDKVVVSCAPNIIIYRDTDGDDKSDKKEVFLTGFGGRDHDHGLHSVTGGLDGKWYFNVGNDGPHEVTDKSGWHLSSGSCYVYGPTGNTGNRKSDDGRVWTGGVALRVDSDGKHLTPLGHNFRNCYEIGRDSFGNMWQSDNDDDGNRGCRFSWLMEGANMGYFSADECEAWGADRRPGQETVTAHWHQDDPGVMPIGDNTGAGGPTGVVVYEGGLLPPKFVGCVFDADAGRNCVWMHRPVADGAGFKFERTQLIAAKMPTTAPTEGDRSNWFRPSDVAVGTDGAIYISDWYDPMVGGHSIKDKDGAGRILRIAPKGDRTQPPKIDLKSLDGALAALKNPAINVRYSAAEAICAYGEKAVGPLSKMASGGEARMRARAIWLLARCGGSKAIEPFLLDREESIRITAFRALRSIDGDALAAAKTLANDSSLTVRREVLISLRDVKLDDCRELIQKLAAQFDGKDRAYLEAIGIACDRKEDPAYVLIVGEGPAMNWSDATAGIAWRLHPPQSVGAFAQRAAAPSLSAAARQQAIVALAFIKDAKASDAMAQLANAGPSDVKAAADWWMRNRATNDWDKFESVRDFVETAPPDPALLKQRADDRNALLDKSRPYKDRKQAAIRMAGDREGGMLIVSLASEDKFPANLVEVVAGPIHRNPDLSVRALASKYFPRTTAAGAALPPIKDLAAMKGDATRGKAVFYGDTASCSRCHNFDGQGRDVGPDLTAIRSKYARPELLDAILNPSANIAFGFEPWIVHTNDGQVYGGFIIADGDTVVLKESSGEKRSIAKKDIKSRSRQTVSVMPDNVALGLDAQQIADLAEFLLTMPVKPEAIRPAKQLLEWLGGHSVVVLVAMLIVVAGTWGFIELADEVREGGTQRFDDWAIRSLRRPDTPEIPIGPTWLHEVGRDMTALGGVAVLMLVTAAVAGYLLIIRKYHAMWLVIITTVGGLLIGSLLKHHFARERPTLVPHLSQVYTSSFPSGHSMLSAVVYLTLGSLLARLVPNFAVKLYFIGVALLLTFLVGLSRVYMGVHYPTDVLAGWTAGLVWACACWLVARYLQRAGAVEKDVEEFESRELKH